jgi:prepilin-type processing-associated H-X9-DG protein
MGNTFLVKTYVCPSDTSAYPNIRPARPGAANPFPFSYTANLNIFVIVGADETPTWSANDLARGVHIPNTPLRYSQIKTPANKITLVEEDAKSIDDQCWCPQNWIRGTATATNVISVRHDKMYENNSDVTTGRGNANFADGHSEPILRADAMAYPTVEGGRYWNPLIP